MSTAQNIIKNRVGLLELAKQLDNVTQACNILGYSRDSLYRYKELYETGRESALADISNEEADREKSRCARSGRGSRGNCLPIPSLWPGACQQ